MTIKSTTREVAIEIIAGTFCEGPSATVGGELAEAIVRNLEAGGFGFATAPEAKPAHKSQAHR